jgi:hypothetical protein
VLGGSTSVGRLHMVRRDWRCGCSAIRVGRVCRCSLVSPCLAHVASQISTSAWSPFFALHEKWNGARSWLTMCPPLARACG